MRLLEGKEQREEAQCPVEKHSSRRNQLSPPSTSARPGAFSNFSKEPGANALIPRCPFRFKGFWSEMVSWKREECLLGSSSSLFLSFLSKPSSGNWQDASHKKRHKCDSRGFARLLRGLYRYSSAIRVRRESAIHGVSFSPF